MQTVNDHTVTASGNENWLYVCKKDRRRTNLRCYLCVKAICIKCAKRTAGVGYICTECKSLLLARHNRNRK